MQAKIDSLDRLTVLFPFGTPLASSQMTELGSLVRVNKLLTRSPMPDSTASLNPAPLRSISGVFAMALLVAAFILLPSVARADSTATYDISGSLLSGGSFSGTIEFDQSGGTLELINTSFTLDGLSFTCGGATSNLCTVFDPFGTSFVNIQGSGATVVLEWIDSSFDISNPPATFSFIGGYCSGCSAFGPDMIMSGTATNVVAPEPAQWILLTLGLGALALFSRRSSNALNRLE